MEALEELLPLPGLVLDLLAELGDLVLLNLDAERQLGPIALV
jgi:hypothetical protein